MKKTITTCDLCGTEIRDPEEIRIYVLDLCYSCMAKKLESLLSMQETNVRFEFLGKIKSPKRVEHVTQTKTARQEPSGIGRAYDGQRGERGGRDDEPANGD